VASSLYNENTSLYCVGNSELIQIHPLNFLSDKEKYPYFPRDMVVYRAILHYRSVMVVVETLKEE
jgi:hypothetical protein